MARYRAVFFDVGDTLIRGRPSAPTFCRIAAEHGVTVDEAAVRQAISAVGPRHFVAPDEVYRTREARGWRVEPYEEEPRRLRYFGEVFAALGVGELAAAAARALRQQYQGPDRWELYPDALPTLDRLRAEGYRLGVISNWAPRLDELCGAMGLSQYFPFILASEEAGFCKPHRHMFDRALALAGVEPDAALYVGDSYIYDVAGARAAGVDAVLLDRRGRHVDPPYSPVIRSLDELFPLLDRAPGVAEARP